jgi:hypothetical protein
MDDRYIEQKQKEIILFFNAIATIEQRKKFIKLLLEAVWLGGKVEGVQEAREAIR